MSNNPRLDAALGYAARGWPVLPLRAGQKVPLTTNGLHDASTNPAVVRDWWSRWPDANVGVRTGAASKLVVVDADVKDGASGRASFAALRLPATMISRTWSKGWHALYQHPGFEIRNRAGLRPGIDIRADGGYIVVPPSVINGATYRWMSGTDAADPAPMPDSLAALLRAPSEPAARPGRVVRQGGRNDYLARKAGALRGQGIDGLALLAALKAENQSRCDPPLEDAEVARVAESINRYPGSRPAPDIDWPAPAQLPADLPPVAAFDLAMLPPILANWVGDVSERLQCPPDYAAVAVMIMLGSLIGRQVGIRPYRQDDWHVVANLWGAVIGRPGVMKTPALREALRPMQALEAFARDEYDQAKNGFDHALEETKGRRAVAADQFRKALKENPSAKLAEVAPPEAPVRRRYWVQDATVEKLGELLNQNPNGLLLFRDELSGWLRSLDRQGREADRSFYLEAWNGDGSFTYDRIGRGTIDIEACCVSILGSIQPGPFLAYVRGARTTSALDDGLLQRFQLAVWPDDPGTYRVVDRPPNATARDAVRALAGFAANLPVGELPKLTKGASVSFVSTAGEGFSAWRQTLENRIRSGDEHPLIESHLAKYRSLVPSLALVLHVAASSPARSLPALVNDESLHMAIRWSEYLETHARRVYAPCIHAGMDAARLLARRIVRSEVPSPFSPRDVYRNGWSGLSDPEDVAAALAVLEDFDWIVAHREATAGRTRLSYLVNPRLAELPEETAIRRTDRTDKSPQHWHEPLIRSTDKTDKSPSVSSVSPSDLEIAAAQAGISVEVLRANLSPEDYDDAELMAPARLAAYARTIAATAVSPGGGRD